MYRVNNTHLDAKLLFTSTIPILHPLYIVVAIILLANDEDSPSALDDLELESTNGCNSTMLESFSFIIGRVLVVPEDLLTEDEPSSTSSMRLGEVARILAPIDMVLG